MSAAATSAATAWSAAAMPAVVVPHAIGPALAAEVRARLEDALYTRYALVDRGSYEHVTPVEEPELLRALVGVAREVTGRALELRAARALRLGPGDYLLSRHDRVHDDRPVELTLDLSSAAVPGADVHYRHRGQAYFAFQSTPGALALVERGPTVMCNHAYVTRRHAGPAVVRLVALLGSLAG